MGARRKGREVCLESQAGRGRANVVVEVGVAAVERGQEGVGSGRGSIQVRQRAWGGIRRYVRMHHLVAQAGRMRERGSGQPVAGRSSGGREMLGRSVRILHGGESLQRRHIAIQSQLTFTTAGTAKDGRCFFFRPA